jgi:hypothetical protein
MLPFWMQDAMALGKGLVTRKVEWLVNNCLQKGHIEPGDNDKVKITDAGREHCESLWS